MKFLRIFLQLLILGFGGIALVALISQPVPDLKSIFGLVGFVAFLLALTLALKEQSGARLLPNYQRSFKGMGIALIVLGAFGIVYGLSFVIGNQPVPNGSGPCRAVCGLILLVAQLFGDVAAKFFAFGLWSGVGIFLGCIGYKLKRVNAV